MDETAEAIARLREEAKADKSDKADKPTGLASAARPQAEPTHASPKKPGAVSLATANHRRKAGGG